MRKIAKPIINKISPIDAKKENVISMSYNGILPYSNRLVIYDADTLLSVYDRTQNSYNLTHVLSADTLKNGIKYAAQAQVFDINGNPSALSDKVYFRTLATPLFYFSNIHDEDIIDNASVYAILNYEQENWEDIAEFRFYLYDEVKNLLIESETYYSTDYLTYSYKGLNDDHFYYIRAMGITVNGIQLDTGYIKIFVNYENLGKYKLIEAKCNEYNSVVTYQTHFVVIHASETESTGAPYEYYDGWINLLGKTLVYNENFLVDGDFTISIRGMDLYRNTTILKCSNDKYGFTLSSYIYDDGQMRYKLTVPNGLCNYILYSEPLLPDPLDIIAVHIRRVNNVYQLYCYIEYEMPKRNMWFGEKRPTSSTLDWYDIWIENGEDDTTRVDKEDVNIFYQENEPIILADKKYDIWIGDNDIIELREDYFDIFSNVFLGIDTPDDDLRLRDAWINTDNSPDIYVEKISLNYCSSEDEPELFIGDEHNTIWIGGE